MKPSDKVDFLVAAEYPERRIFAAAENLPEKIRPP